MLTMAEQDVPEHLQETTPITRRLRELAGDEGLAAYALRYVASLPGMSGAVVGMETIEQLRGNVATIERGPLPSATMAAIDEMVPDLPSHIVNPGDWRWNDPYEWKKPKNG